MMTEETRFVRSSNVLGGDLEDQLALMDIEKGDYYTLDKVAKTIWNCLETPRSFDDLCADLEQRYVVEGTDFRRDVKEFLGELHDRNLVTLQNA